MYLLWSVLFWLRYAYVEKIPGSPCDTYSCWGEPGNEATRNHMWQSHVEIEDFSVKYVDHNSLFEAPYC